MKIHGVAEMVPSFKRRIGVVRAPYGDVRSPRAMVEAADAFEGLSLCLYDAVQAMRASDGRIDLRDVANFVVRRMRAHPKKRTKESSVRVRINMDKAASALARCLDKAFESGTHEGFLDLKDVASHVLAELRRPVV